MAKEIRAKTFRSGNSVALRLPRALNFAEGDEVTIVPHQNGGFTLYKTGGAKEVFMKLYGSMSPGFMAEGRMESEQGERDWSSPSVEAA